MIKLKMKYSKKLNKNALIKKEMNIKDNKKFYNKLKFNNNKTN